MPVQAVVKIVLGTVGNILGFTANVLVVVDSVPRPTARVPLWVQPTQNSLPSGSCMTTK